MLQDMFKFIYLLPSAMFYITRNFVRQIRYSDNSKYGIFRTTR